MMNGTGENKDIISISRYRPLWMDNLASVSNDMKICGVGDCFWRNHVLHAQMQCPLFQMGMDRFNGLTTCFQRGCGHPVPSLLSPVLTEPPFQDCGNFYGCPY
ncbi:hypothetical protein H3T44_08590, partial [Commensalibacter sp. M0355]|uniref:hypothetical protein n=1 Tax=Commensalibacter sp. M0355 TaxID=2750978 RepID=UPI0018F027F0